MSIIRPTVVFMALITCARISWSQASQAPKASVLSPKRTGNGNVQVYTDEFGVPHIFADTDEGAFFGLGYVQVRDQPINALTELWRPSGRLAEIVGESALDRDKEILHWELPTLAQEQLVQLDADTKSVLDAYVAGVEAART